MLMTILLGLLSGVCWWQIRLLGDPRASLAVFYGWYAAAFTCYLAMLWCIHRAQRTKSAAVWLGTAVIIVAALAFRAILLPVTPILSDDIYRYLWDGRVQLAGINPYAYAPNDPALQGLRNELWSSTNFSQLRTIYPPVTQQAFLLGAWLSPTLMGQKLVFVGAELIVVACLVALLRLRNLSPLWVAAYAWHPLVILEIAGSGHNDTVGLAWLWAGLLAWQLKHPALAAVGWAGALLSKYTTVILAPWWWFRRTARRWLILFGALAALPIACCPPIVTALFESLSAMATRFESNSSVYLLVATAVRHPALARLLVAGLWLALVIWLARRQDDPLRFLLGALAAAALLSPVLHPWYLVWVVPCFCFWRPTALVALTGLVVLAYTVWPGYLAGGPWVVPTWARLAEYVPVFAIGLWGWRSFDSSRATQSRVGDSLRIVVNE